MERSLTDEEINNLQVFYWISAFGSLMWVRSYFVPKPTTGANEHNPENQNKNNLPTPGLNSATKQKPRLRLPIKTEHTTLMRTLFWEIFHSKHSNLFSALVYSQVS